MLQFFPIIGEDEIVYSVLAELYTQLNLSSWSKFSKKMFGHNRHNISIEWPSRIGELISRFPIGHSYTSNDFINNHTLLPLYRPFKSVRKFGKLRSLMKEYEPRKTYSTAHVSHKFARLIDYLQYCKACIHEDTNKYGRAYWHRSHQVPGVTICYKHHTWLERSCVPIRNRSIKDRLIPLHIGSDLSLKPINIFPQAWKKILTALATDVNWLLTNHEHAISLTELDNLLSVALWNAGYSTKNNFLRNSRFLNDFQSFFSEELLTNINLEIDFKLYTPWPLQIRRINRRLHPIQYLLVIHFLGSTIEEFFQQPQQIKHFGDGPWPCLNPVCPHYHQFVIRECDSHPLDWIDRCQGTFECSCGFIYRRSRDRNKPDDIFKIDKIIQFGSLWEDSLQKLLEDTSLNRREIAKKLNVSITVLRMKIESLQTLCNIAPLPIEKKVTKRHLRVDKEEEIQEYRKIWLAVIDAFPNKTKSEICHELKFDRVYKWLFDYDKKWLMANTPKVDSQNKENRFLSAEIQRKLRDLHFSVEAFSTAQKLLQLQEEPIRLHKIKMLRPLQKKSLVLSEKNNMPITSSLLNASTESYFSFFIRRFEWIYKFGKWDTITDLKKATNYFHVKGSIEEEIIEDFWQKVTSSTGHSPSLIHSLLPSSARNWSERDKQLAAQVKKAADQLRQQDGYPTKITKPAIGHHIDRLEQFIFHIEMLPLTRQSLDNEIETDSDYLDRILQWAKIHFVNKKTCPKFDTFFRLIGLTQFEEQQYIEDLAKKTFEEINKNIIESFLNNFSLNEIDILFAKQIDEAIIILRNNGESSNLPERISSKRIWIFLEVNAHHLFPYWEIFTLHLDHLPLTSEILKQSSETDNELISRRLYWAAEKYRSQKVCPTKTQLKIYASIKKFDLEPWVGMLVGEIQKSLAHFPTIYEKNLQDRWSERDNILVDYIKPISDELKSQNSPWIRVTKKIITKELKQETGYDSSAQLNKLPLTESAILETVESPTQYIERKISSISFYYQQNAICPNLTAFLKKGRIHNEYYQYAWCKKAVDNALEKLSCFPTEMLKDWNKIDSELSRKVKRIIHNLLEATPFVRITVSRVSKIAEYRYLSMHIRKGNLPKTKAILDEYTETGEGFAWRRLNHATDLFKKQGVIPSKKEIINTAHLQSFANRHKFMIAISNATTATA